MADTITPIPEVDGLDAAFGSIKHLPPWSALTDAEKANRGPFCEAAQLIFFKGGRLRDYGLTPKPGVDVGKVTALLRAVLSSFEPKHEHKIGGAGHLLAQWFDAEGEQRP